MTTRRRWLRRASTLVLALLAYAAYELGDRFDFGEPAGSEITAPGRSAEAGGEAEILTAYRDRTSGVMVEAGATVQRLLEDDLDGSRHQRLIAELASGHTVLISHNIDLAPRVPLEPGDRFDFRGQYEWNDRGGVVHWTHHDPAGRRAGGWIRHRGREYR